MNTEPECGCGARGDTLRVLDDGKYTGEISYSCEECYLDLIRNIDEARPDFEDHELAYRFLFERYQNELTKANEEIHYLKSLAVKAQLNQLTAEDLANCISLQSEVDTRSCAQKEV